MLQMSWLLQELFCQLHHNSPFQNHFLQIPLQFYIKMQNINSYFLLQESKRQKKMFQTMNALILLSEAFGFHSSQRKMKTLAMICYY